MGTGTKIFIMACLCLAISAGTDNVAAKSSGERPQEKPLLIGLIPEQNIFKQVERYEPLAVYLSQECGIRIKLKVLTRYGNIVGNFVSLGMDGAFFGSFTYALAHRKLGVEVLARPEGPDGTSTYHGLIFVREDSGIRTIREMKGKRFAFVDKATTAGYLLPLAYFMKHGIADYKTYFRETYFTGTHQDTIYDVLNKKADIGAAKNTIYKRISNADRRITNELVILEKSPDVPENGLAVRKGLDDSLKNRLKEALLTMHDDPTGKNILRDFGARRFIETRDNDYKPVYKYAREINLNLATYDYMNQ
jgi:phosphonate transport system substrate-binding protein